MHRWRRWTGEAGYMFADARLSTGERIPQIPKQQGTAQLTYNFKSTLISAGVRAYGLQFDDDLNQFLLPGFTVVQLTAQQELVKNFYAVATVENLLDRTYLVALTPTPNTGAPLLWRVGLRWRGSLK
jgi:outer membrane receptor protein involved in Fe transport